MHGVSAVAALIAIQTIACQGERLQSNTVLNAVCPHKLSFDSKGECIDSDLRAPVESKCCDGLRGCTQELADAQTPLDVKVQEFMGTCGLLETDLAMKDGVFQIADTTRLCAPKCEPVGSTSIEMPDVAALEAKCGTADAKALVRLTTTAHMLDALQSAAKACSASEPTCPEDGAVFGSATDKCADAQGVALPADCCAVVDKCDEEISNIQAPIETHYSDYVKTCKLEESDTAQQANGGFRVTDTTRLCAETCTTSTVGDTSINVPPLTSLEEKCGKGGAKTKLDKLKMMSKKVSAIDVAVKKCEELFVVDEDEHGLVFVIDVSGSMNRKFSRKLKGSSEQGRKFEFVSKISLLQTELIKQIQGLDETKDTFSIISFNNVLASFSETLVKASAGNKDLAKTWIEGLSPEKGTELKAPLEAAFSMEGVDAVHLLSDGAPDDCWSADSKDRCLPTGAENGKVPVHTTLLMPGTSSTKERSLMQAIAKATGGSFREPFK